MAQVTHPGVFVLSLDFRPESQADASSQQRAATTVLAQLAECAIPATWTLAERTAPLVAPALVAEGQRHEISICGTADWAGAQASRRDFTLELLKRLRQAHSQGYSPRTLSLVSGQPTAHADILVKQGISAIHSLETPPLSRPGVASWLARLKAPATSCSTPHSLRWGLWHFHSPMDYLTWGPRRIERAIEAAIADGGVVHVSTNISRLAAGGSVCQKAWQKTLRQVGQWRQQEVLEVHSIASAVSRLSRGSQSTPARSILQRKAA